MTEYFLGRLYVQFVVLASNRVYERMETRYMDAVAMIDERLEELNEGLNSSIGPAGSAAILMQSQGPTQTVIFMERPPEVGTFDGKPTDWPSFRDLFIAEVHDRDNIDPVSKLIYLQRALKGTAAKTLGPWKPTSENYAPAWKVMLEAYNDDYHVIHGMLGKMFAVRKQEKESHGALRMIVCMVVDVNWRH